jgi:protein CpxP
MKRQAKALVVLIAMLVVLPIFAQVAQAQGAPSPDKQEAMAKLEKMSAALNLTPAQKKQMMPIMMEEGQKMKAIKGNSSLGPLEKGMQMKQVGTDMDAKVKPILSPDQYQKFEAMRAQEREQMIQKMRSGQ